MKKLLIIVIMMAAMAANAQYNTPNVQKKNVSGGTEMVKGFSTLTTGFAIAGIGLIAAVTAPHYIDIKSKDYVANVKTIQIAGCGVAMLGVIIGISSIKSFKLAGKIIDAKLNGDGLGISMKF